MTYPIKTGYLCPTLDGFGCWYKTAFGPDLSNKDRARAVKMSKRIPSKVHGFRMAIHNPVEIRARDKILTPPNDFINSIHEFYRLTDPAILIFGGSRCNGPGPTEWMRFYYV